MKVKIQSSLLPPALPLPAPLCSSPSVTLCTALQASDTFSDLSLLSLSNYNKLLENLLKNIWVTEGFKSASSQNEGFGTYFNYKILTKSYTVALLTTCLIKCSVLENDRIAAMYC